MNKNFQLNLTNKKGLYLINSWITDIKESEKQVDISLTNKYAPGEGQTLIDISNNTSHIRIGSNMQKIFPLNRLPIDDRDFVKIGVTLFHEVNHYQQHTKEYTEECLLSELSKYKNDSYYKESWHELPHEIHAEYSGVMTMWKVMTEEFTPEQADDCVLDYINTKASQTKYMIPPISGSYQSKKEVEHAFEQAYEKSLTEKRTFQPNFLRYEDEVSRLFTDNGILKAEYHKHYQTLISNIPGDQKDRLLSSTVVHLHPELQREYPSLDFRHLSMEETFQLPSLETSLESRQRIIQTQDANDFVKAVEDLSDIQTNVEQL